MTFKERLARNINVFFNLNEFAETVMYNGNSIVVVPNLGSDLEDGNIVGYHGTSARAIFYLKAVEVPIPRHGDILTYNGEDWTVVQVVYSKGGVHKIACTGRESVL